MRSPSIQVESSARFQGIETQMSLGDALSLAGKHNLRLKAARACGWQETAAPETNQHARRPAAASDGGGDPSSTVLGVPEVLKEHHRCLAPVSDIMRTYD